MMMRNSWGKTWGYVPPHHPQVPRADQAFWATVGDHWCQSCGERNPSEVENISNYMELGHVILDQDHDPNCDGSCSHCPIQVARICGLLKKKRPDLPPICDRCRKPMKTPAYLGNEIVCVFCFANLPLTSSIRSQTHV